MADRAADVGQIEKGAQDLEPEKVTPRVPEGHAEHGSCDLCWDEAFKRSRMLGGSQVDHYKNIVWEVSRDARDHG